MNRQRIGFPLIVGLTAEHTASLSAAGLTGITDVFRKLRERSRFGVLIVHNDGIESAEQIAEAAKEAGVNYRATEGASGTQTAASAKGGLTPADMELVETADVLILISSTAADRDNGKYGDLLTYARGIGRPVIRIDGETGTLEGGVPQQIEVDQGWLPELFEMAGLSPDADLQTIKSKMSALANRTAPLTRSRWNWIVFIQGLAVCIPLGWLLGFPVRFVALGASFFTLLVVVLHFWLRWKSMQKTWAQARLVAEASRSLIATAACPDASPWQTLATVPSLRPLRSAKRPQAVEQPFPDWLNQYVGSRVLGQQKYFVEKRQEAEQQRQRLTSWTSLLLDVALVLALVGLVLVFIPAADEWMVGGIFSARVLGCFTILVLLGLLLIQIIREVHELNRRTARFAQQEVMLRDAMNRLNRIEDPDLALNAVRDIESKLLAEVLEWYFHADTAERFIETRESRRRALPRNFLKDQTTAEKFAHAIPGKAGTAGLFILKAILGRLPYIVLPAAAVVVWIFYHLPDQGANINELEAAVNLLAANDKDSFGPGDNKERNYGKGGYIVLVHGLWGLGILTPQEKENQRNWMKDWPAVIKKQLADKGNPEICLVDWSRAAKPSDFYNRVFGERSFLADVPAIRAQAYRVGDIVANKLAGVILSNNLPRNVPVHLIGHSAGGFVVTRIARRLFELGLVDKSKVHVTILDTPAPDKELTQTVPDLYPKDEYGQEPVDFYVSSDLGGRAETLRSAPLSVNVHEYKIPSEKESFWSTVRHLGRAHRYSCDWYRETIEHPENFLGQGFSRSPWLREAPAGDGR